MRPGTAHRAAPREPGMTRPALRLVVSRGPTGWQRWRRRLARVARNDRVGEVGFLTLTLGLVMLLFVCLGRAVNGYPPLP